tara:strand:+ start:155117 stop:155821 length:705 start_codon:yes stop_codon:yes gene_type:complete
LRQISKIALLVFVRDARQEALVKPIFKGDDRRNEQLYTFLNKRIINEAKSSSYDYYVISSKDQVGTDFADRFKNAFKAIFELGYDAVISVGNDVPQVNRKTIEEVSSAFSDKDVVIGKTSKNGAYTLGLTKYAFTKCDFEAVDWSSKNVARSIKERAIDQGSSYIELDKVYYEINSHDDLKLFIKSISHCNITFQGVLFLVGLFYDQRKDIHFQDVRNSFYFTTSFEIRGSPLL